MATPVLDLSTLEPDRPSIRIDGTSYSLAVRDDFGPREYAYISNAGAKVQAMIGTIEELSEEDADRMATFVDRATSMLVPDCPAEVLAKLRFSQKISVINAFGVAAQTTDNGTQGAAEQTERTNQSTGETSSRDSSDSTEEIPSDGSPSRSQS